MKNNKEKKLRELIIKYNKNQNYQIKKEIEDFNTSSIINMSCMFFKSDFN
jgi:hypothetical protein